jgi:hypothetical protein
MNEKTAASAHMDAVPELLTAALRFCFCNLINPVRCCPLLYSVMDLYKKLLGDFQPKLLQ